MLLVAVLTAFISVNGAVAALLPVVVVTAIRLGRSPSQMLLPLAFAAHAGSMLALTGTPVNVIVSDAAAGAHLGRFGYFDFTPGRRATARRHGGHRGRLRPSTAARAHAAIPAA
jgi:Na+/H+ antiporter NhaD/arsenite permease-like protein